jgi:hypothetical protein
MHRLKGFFICCAALVVAATMNAPSFATLCIGDQVRVSFFVPQTNGDWIDADGTHDHLGGQLYAGEYLITNTATNESFATFCLQLNVDIQPFGDPILAADPTIAGHTGLYSVASILDNATGGGQDVPVANATKWLWETYLDHTDEYPGYSWNAIDVQEAIWKLQGDIGSSSFVNQITGAALDLYNLALQHNANDDSISALNLIQVGTNEAGQSMLILQAPQNAATRGGGATPEPMTLAIWGGLSVVGLMVGRQRRRVAG